VTAHYAASLAGWDGQTTEALRARLKGLRELSGPIVALRRGNHAVARMKLEKERLDFARERFAEESARGHSCAQQAPGVALETTADDSAEDQITPSSPRPSPPQVCGGEGDRSAHSDVGVRETSNVVTVFLAAIGQPAVQSGAPSSTKSNHYFFRATRALETGFDATSHQRFRLPSHGKNDCRGSPFHGAHRKVSSIAPLRLCVFAFKTGSKKTVAGSSPHCPEQLNIPPSHRMKNSTQNSKSNGRMFIPKVPGCYRFVFGTRTSAVPAQNELFKSSINCIAKIVHPVKLLRA